jgi:hypothetical protein
MHISTSLKAACALATTAALALVAPLAAQAGSAQAVAAAGAKVTVRVEGVSSTLLAQTSVSTQSTSIDKDGKSADACTGDTAAVALQDATHGDWTAGPYSASLGYPVIGIRGESHAFTSPYYWSFWVDDKPATTGICGATLHSGESVLFFPQCSEESASKCPQGLFNPAVLDLSGPTSASVGKPVAFAVKALSNLTGKASAGAHVKLSAAGQSVKTSSSGKASLTFRHAGSYKVVATASDSIRDELTVRVSGG